MLPSNLLSLALAAPTPTPGLYEDAVPIDAHRVLLFSRAHRTAIAVVDLRSGTLDDRTDEADAMRVIETDRARAIPALLAAQGPQAALGLLRAPEADAWLREQVVDPEVYIYDGDAPMVPCRAIVGQLALEHLHQRPLRELVVLPPSERQRLEALAAHDGHSGPADHARFLLEQLGHR